MERKERKGVRLHTYDYSQNGVYFVTLCATDRKKLFGEIVGDCTPPACNPSVAPHNQLLPHTIATLKRFVHRDVGYTVFQRSYYDHVVRGEQDYREIWEYIDQNPQKWQLDRFFVCE